MSTKPEDQTLKIADSLAAKMRDYVGLGPAHARTVAWDIWPHHSAYGHRALQMQVAYALEHLTAEDIERQAAELRAALA